MVQPLSKPKRVKKFGLKKFNRHQHDRKIAVKVGDCRSFAGSTNSIFAKLTEGLQGLAHRMMQGRLGLAAL